MQFFKVKSSFSAIYIAAIFVLTACSSLVPQEDVAPAPAAIPPPPFQVFFVLEDSTFNSEQEIVFEVIESGESLTSIPSAATNPNERLSLVLPEDENWTICASQEKVQECYSIVYPEYQPGSSDSQAFGKMGRKFNAELSEYNKVKVFSKLADLSKLNLQKMEVDTSTIIEPTSSAETISKSTQLKKVVVRVKRRPKRALGQSTVSAKSIKRMPALAEADVIKAIQALPGVVASSDFSSKIYVRGGGADQNLFLFDNGVVYSPVHFFGLFSTFLVEGLDDVNFYKGGFTPEFGNRLSSVLDLKSRQGADKKEDAWFVNSSIKVSTFATQLHTEGKQDEFSWLFAYRQTYIKETLEALAEVGISDIELNYRFTDLQGNIVWQPSGDEKIMVSGYVGGDTLDFDVFKVTWGNQVYPVNYWKKINDDWKLQANYAYSQFGQVFALGEIFQFVNGIETHTVKTKFEYSAMTNQNWTIGVEQRWTDAYFGREILANDINSRDEGMYSLSSPFIQNQIRLGNWFFQPGLRVNYQDLLDAWTYEPRISTTYAIDRNRKIDFHVGKYYQYVNSILFSNFESINEFYYPSKKVPGKTIEPSNSILFSLGFSEEKLLDKYNWGAEVYYKTLNNLISYDPNSQPDSVLTNVNAKLGQSFEKSEGYSYGLELSFRKPAGIVYGGISYSYGYSVLNENNEVFPANWDKPHSVKTDLSLNWKGKQSESIWTHKEKGRYLRSSTGLSWTSGLPFTGVTGYYKTHGVDQGGGERAGGPNPVLEGNIATPYDGRNETRYPDYFRWDIKIIDMGRYNKWNFSWTILNITNNENVLSYNYTQTNPPKRQTTAQFPFFPLLLSFEYYF